MLEKEKKGVKENMYWIPIAELEKYKGFPTFMKEGIVYVRCL